MSQQLQITGGAKVRDLQDVIIGTSGVLSSLAFNVANGVPKLDVNGKILVSQLPNSVMEYLGTWDASTNTPTLVNGTGNQGDVYLCNVAGTVNFGAGPITFAVGDSAIYSGTIWQKAGGATGTVTSVGLTSTGNDAITITGSPITTSGNINLGFAGTNLQYINGAGDLTTFPTLISSIGLSMPSAFSVANSPLTSNGTIAVTGAGYPSQYIRGDGTLADFPTSGGGGSSVSYYLNGGTSQGTIGGVTYYEMSKTADTGTGVDFTKSGDGFIVAFLTDAGDPAQLNIPAGNWNYEIYASMSANGGTPQMYSELYKYDGTTFTLISTSTNEILYDGTNLNLYTFAMTVPSTTLAITDRLAVKLYATNSGGKTTTVHTQDSHLCQVITTFSTGITALNGLTAQVQYFATGTSGTDFNISSATATHTFNLPVASATNTGKLSSTDWSTFNGKVPYTGANADVDLGLFSLTSNAVKAIGDNSTYGGVISIKQNNVIGGLIGTGYTELFGKTNRLGISFGAGSIAYISNSVLTAERTFTLPDASGTLALTSNLSSYVPYTGATGDVNLGVNFLKARTFYSEGNGGGGSYAIKNGASPSFEDGYTILSSNDYRLNILSTVSTVTKAVYLGFSSVTATRTYTLPDASGTIALLESTQTFTGTNTFSGLTSFTFSSGTRMDYGPYLTKGSVPSAFSGSTTNIYSDATTNNIVIRDNSSIAKLVFDNSTQTFTFPAASGTIALTSNITSAISGNTNYHAKFTGTSTIGNSLIWDNGTNVGIGNTNTSYTLDVSGTLRATGAATFSSSVTMGGDLNFSANDSAISFSSGAGRFFTGGAERMRITSGGNVGIGTSSPANLLHLAGTSATPSLRLSSSANIAFYWDIGRENASTGDFVFNNAVGASSTERLRITAAGNVGIGITTPSAKLDLGSNFGTAGTINKISLYNTGTTPTYGFGISAAQLDYVSVNDHVFYTGATLGERMRITSTGTVNILNDCGVGGAGDTGTRLVVYGKDSTSSNNAFLVFNSASTDLFLVRNDGLFRTGTAASSPYNNSQTGRTPILASNGTLGYLVSTRESKANIESIKSIDFINQLNPVQFNYRKKDDKTNTFTDEVEDNITYGFIADEVEVVNKDLAFYNEDGSLAGVEYNSMIAILTKAVQEQQAIITSLQDRLDKLENK